ncbi:MAG: sensor histidine kinase [Verrucomicrobia bacterium]|nr:sensor histidine kinase [Cytophagales bacterium]
MQRLLFILGTSVWFIHLLPAQTLDLLRTATRSDAVIETNLAPYLSIFHDTKSQLSFEEVKNLPFSPLSTYTRVPTPVQWLRFTIYNTSPIDRTDKISIIFTDLIDLYVPDKQGNYRRKPTGDLIPLSQREINLGQMVFANLPVWANQKTTFYIKLTSKTKISKQFRALALKSVMLYSEERFRQLFIESRIYQAAFYGGIAVIILYNLFLFISLRSIFLLNYLLFTSALVIFLAANNGFLAEIFFGNYPRTDLYVRFLSTPVLLFFYTLFSKSYLKLPSQLPVINRIMNYWLLVLVCLIIYMLAGYWQEGRSAVIVLGIINFAVIAGVALLSMQRGFVPARYFLAANALFLISGTWFALQRINLVVYNPLEQYQTQISAVFQVALLSLGLAERMQLIRKELAEKTLENERLERQKEQELKKVTEEKNLELQKAVNELDMFIYRTAHDIRGPLARLLGLNQVALLDVIDKPALEYLQKLDVEAQNLNLILLRLAKAHEIKYLTPRKEKVKVGDLFEKISQAQLSKTVESENLDFQIAGNLNMEIISDAELLGFIFNNLLENALRFRKKLPEQKDQIHVNFEQNEHFFTLTVKDNGIGIEEKYQPLIFDMFSRAAGIHKTIGLGLYMCRLCADKLGGSIQLIPDSQTEFEVKIPC